MKTHFVFNKKICIALILALCAALCVFAVPLEELYIMAEDGTFLGTFEDRYSLKSIYNQYGIHGSKFSYDSIFNKNSNYGSDYSQYSPFNKYSNNAPYLMDRYGNYYGRLSINKYAQDVSDYNYRLALQLKGLRDSM